MKYRLLENTDYEASILGLSAASLPVPGDSEISDNQLVDLIQYCLEIGVNYIDLGYPYRPEKQKYLSGIINQALKSIPRDNLIITVTIPSYAIKTAGDFDRFLNRQLEWLSIERADFCLLGMLNRDNWPALMELQVLDWAEKARQDGRIGHLGFSYHDHFQVLKKIITAYDKWIIGQFQYSYVDEEHDPGSSGIKYARDRGLNIVISEPLHRKRLSNNLPSEVLNIINSSPGNYSPAGWALRWVWDHPEVAVVLGEIASMDNAEEHINTANFVKPGSLSIKELIAYGKINDYYQAKKIVPCPSCRACMPCPEGIDVPRIFEIYNDAEIYSNYQTAREIYAEENHKIERCTECGSCEKSCAKRLNIIDYLKEAQKALSQ
ncbi:MAG: aldo/keto reductase [Bacillota bacterium]|nr:aldo/keto reductase [Bacillota bacterium]